MYTEAVRVATSNNFNCTDAEWDQLDGFAAANPSRFFFVNSNARTPRLPSVADHPYRVVVTANPDLAVDPRLESRALALPADRVAFYRVKWLPGDAAIIGLAGRIRAAGRQVVVTPQRFARKATLLHFSNPESYRFECSRYRLHGPAWDAMLAAADGMGALVCDRKGLGCRACGQCSRLASGLDLPVSSLNLSTSGECLYDCPDCYAKSIRQFLAGMGQKPSYDTIKANDKQSGRTEHIRRNSHAQAAA